jgi:chromosome segregation ATPase
MDSTNRMEIMSMEEGGNKLKAPPQSHPIPLQRSLEYSPAKHQGAGRSERRPEMASGSDNKPSTEERLKAMDTALENLKQLLQFQLDFLENLDSEAGRRMEKLEEDITTTKIGFTEELGKLHRELKNPQQEFEERIDQLEAKMAQLNNDWKQDPEN